MNDNGKKKLTLNGNATWIISTVIMLLVTVIMATVNVVNRSRADTLAGIKEIVNQNAGIVLQNASIVQESQMMVKGNAKQIEELQKVVAETQRWTQENRTCIAEIKSSLQAMVENQKDFKSDLREIKKAVK